MRGKRYRPRDDGKDLASAASGPNNDLVCRSQGIHHITVSCVPELVGTHAYIHYGQYACTCIHDRGQVHKCTLNEWANQWEHESSKHSI